MIIIGILSSITGLSLAATGFFIKQLYKEFRKLAERVHVLDANFMFHVKWYNKLHEHYGKEIQKLKDKITQNGKMN